MAGEPILLAVDGLPLGGTERQMLELVRGLNRNGRFSVVVAVLDRGGELEAPVLAEAARTLPVRRRARFDATPAAVFTWPARQARVRLIHAVGWMSGMACLLAARVLRVPIVNGSVRSAPARLGRRDRISRWCAWHSDGIVANSQAGLRAYGLSVHPRAEVIPNGVDFARFAGVSREREPRPTICMVANFSSWKDHDTIIRAMPHVVRALPACQLLLVGVDRGTLTANRRLAEALGVTDSIRFVTGDLQPEHLVASSDVGVLSTHGESFSNAIVEYMAMGKPVVATDTCGDTAALLRDGGSGDLVPSRSPERMADAVIALLRDPVRAQRMGEAGRRQAALLTVPRMVAAYEAHYDRLLGAAEGDRELRRAARCDAEPELRGRTEG